MIAWRTRTEKVWYSSDSLEGRIGPSSTSRNTWLIRLPILLLVLPIGWADVLMGAEPCLLMKTSGGCVDASGLVGWLPKDAVWRPGFMCWTPYHHPVLVSDSPWVWWSVNELLGWLPHIQGHDTLKHISMSFRVFWCDFLVWLHSLSDLEILTPRSGLSAAPHGGLVWQLDKTKMNQTI